MLVKDPRAYLRFAHAERFAMPAFNVCNLEMTKAVLEAAVAERAPLIVQTYPGDLAHASIGNVPGALADVVKSMAAQVDVPVFLHLDHGPSFEYDALCLRAGYSSVMFDGHELPLEQAIAETSAIANMAHALGAAVEGELGTFGAGQGSHEYTNLDDVLPMFERGGCDMLAVSVGSQHGEASRLDMNLLRAISERANRPLVLHGGSGIHPDDVRAAIQLGVVKINIGTGLFRAWNQGSREALDAGGTHLDVLGQSMLRIREEAVRRLRLMGASGRA